MNRTHVLARFLLPILACAAAPIAAAGPPNICHPLEIGDAATLPMKGPMEPSDLPAERVVAETLRLLDASDSVLVHMETLRRAWLHMERRAEPVAELLDRLRERIVDAEADEATPRARGALRWFDLGHFAAILREGGASGAPAAGKYLDKALRLDPEAATLRFGIACARLDRDREAWYRNLHAAARDAGDDELLRENIRLALQRFEPELDDDAWPKVVERLAAKVAALDRTAVKQGGV